MASGLTIHARHDFFTIFSRICLSNFLQDMLYFFSTDRILFSSKIASLFSIQGNFIQSTRSNSVSLLCSKPCAKALIQQLPINSAPLYPAALLSSIFLTACLALFTGCFVNLSSLQPQQGVSSFRERGKKLNLFVPQITNRMLNIQSLLNSC